MGVFSDTELFFKPISSAYTEDLGAVGGVCLEDDTSALRLDEDSEHPPMILRTD